MDTAALSEQFDGFNHPLFINVSADFLASDTFLPIEPSRVIVELVERITPDDAVVENVKRWAKQGFRFAFDDFEYSYAWESLLKYCDIIKVDISQVTAAQLVLTRASTCAEVARRVVETSIDPDKAFLAGLLSGSDILLNVDKQTFVSSLDLSNEIKDAAIRQRGAMGALIRMVEQVETAQYQWQSNNQDNLTQPVTPKLGPTGLKIIGIYREQAIENQKFVSSMC